MPAIDVHEQTLTIIKLENLLVGSVDGEVKIADFGLAVRLESPTGSFSAPVGTPLYVGALA